MIPSKYVLILDFCRNIGMQIYMQIYMHIHAVKEVFVCMLIMLTTKFYGVALLWFASINTILTHNQSAIEVCSGSDWCSWCNDGCTCHHFCHSELKWGVVCDLATTRKKPTANVQWWNVPLVSNRRNCTGECHSLPRTWSFYTGLQLSTWHWRWTVSLVQTAHKNWLFWYKEYSCELSGKVKDEGKRKQYSTKDMHYMYFYGSSC